MQGVHIEWVVFNKSIDTVQKSDSWTIHESEWLHPNMQNSLLNSRWKIRYVSSYAISFTNFGHYELFFMEKDHKQDFHKLFSSPQEK